MEAEPQIDGVVRMPRIQQTRRRDGEGRATDRWGIEDAKVLTDSKKS